MDRPTSVINFNPIYVFPSLCLSPPLGRVPGVKTSWHARWRRLAPARITVRTTGWPCTMAATSTRHRSANSAAWESFPSASSVSEFSFQQVSLGNRLLILLDLVKRNSNYLNYYFFPLCINKTKSCHFQRIIPVQHFPHDPKFPRIEQ